MELHCDRYSSLSSDEQCVDAHTDAAYQRWLTSFVRAQLEHFTGSVTVVRAGGQPGVRIEFARPSPLGLLTG